MTSVLTQIQEHKFIGDIYVTQDGSKGRMIRMDEGNMAVRSFEK
jgi:hypothetical protein